MTQNRSIFFLICKKVTIGRVVMPFRTGLALVIAMEFFAAMCFFCGVMRASRAHAPSALRRRDALLATRFRLHALKG
jgi:hypothetical protein